MGNGTRQYVGEEQRSERERWYDDKRCQIIQYSKIEQYSMKGIVAGIAIFAVGLYAAAMVNNPQGKTKVFQKHKAAVTSLNALERKRDNPEFNLPYIPEEAMPHLANFYKERVGRVKSLDELIGVYKKDISEIEQSEEFIAKTEIERKANSKVKYAGRVMFGGMGLVFLSLLGRIVSKDNRKTLTKELEERKLEENLA